MKFCLKRTLTDEFDSKMNSSLCATMPTSSNTTEEVRSGTGIMLTKLDMLWSAHICSLSLIALKLG